MQKKETLIGYNSKKQSYIFLIVAIIVFIIAILCFLFADGDKKYASIGCIVVGILFLFGFIHLLKLPEVALKIIDDKEIYFYEKDSVKVIDLYSVIEVKYWPAQIGLKITFVTHESGEHFTYLLKNSKQVKKHILNLLEKYNIPIKKKYNRTY